MDGIKKNNEMGITLVALMVTVIIMIILLSVSIAILTGDEPIVEKTREVTNKSKIDNIKTAVQQYILAKERELINRKRYTYQLSIMDIYTDNCLYAYNIQNRRR